MTWLLLSGYGRRLRGIGEWFSLATVLAGVVVWLAWSRGEPPLTSTVLAIALLAPGLVLWHFVHTVASLSAYFGRSRPYASRRLLRFGFGLSVLVRPWYWSLLVISFAAALVLLPLALLVSLR